MRHSIINVYLFDDFYVQKSIIKIWLKVFFDM